MSVWSHNLGCTGQLAVPTNFVATQPLCWSLTRTTFGQQCPKQPPCSRPGKQQGTLLQICALLAMPGLVARIDFCLPGISFEHCSTSSQKAKYGPISAKKSAFAWSLSCRRPGLMGWPLAVAADLQWRENWTLGDFHLDWISIIVKPAWTPPCLTKAHSH